MIIAGIRDIRAIRAIRGQMSDPFRASAGSGLASIRVRSRFTESGERRLKRAALQLRRRRRQRLGSETLPPRETRNRKPAPPCRNPEL